MKNKGFLISVLLLTGLIVGACFVPTLVFAVQDSFRMGSTQTELRDGLDVENLNIPYELSVSKRLENFAEGLDQYFVTGTEGGDNSDRFMLLEEILYGEFLNNMVALGILRGNIYEGYNIDVMKKYVVYNEVNSEVAIMAWYAKLMLNEAVRLELLWDERTGTVYYVRMTEGEDAGFELQEEINQSAQDFVPSGTFYETYDNQKTFTDAEQDVIEMVSSNMFDHTWYCSSYYGSSLWESLNKALEDGNYGIEETDNGDESGYVKSVLYIVEDGRNIPLFTGYHQGDSNGDTFLQSYQFPFGDDFLEIFFRTRQKYDQNYSCEVTFGIRELGNLIPELAEN